MAEDELVEIVPNLRMDSLNFICVFSSFSLFSVRSCIFAFVVLFHMWVVY